MNILTLNNDKREPLSSKKPISLMLNPHLIVISSQNYNVSIIQKSKPKFPSVQIDHCSLEIELQSLEVNNDQVKIISNKNEKTSLRFVPAYKLKLFFSKIEVKMVADRHSAIDSLKNKYLDKERK
jgi:hypothetical protein